MPASRIEKKAMREAAGTKTVDTATVQLDPVDLS